MKIFTLFFCLIHLNGCLAIKIRVSYFTYLPWVNHHRPEERKDLSSGIYTDMMNIISKKLGLDVSYKFETSLKDMMQNVSK